MRKSEYKKRFIEACETVLQEYVAGKSSDELCALCGFDGLFKGGCMDCISGHWGFLGCSKRKCMPDGSRRLDRELNIAFWQAVIKWLKDIAEEHWFEIGKNPRFAHVKKIDEQIYKQFNKI